MKLNIKTLAASLLVGLSLVSCNNDFDEDGGKTTYPAKGELCSWSRDYTAASNTSYLLNLYVNEEGDTLADLSIFNPVSERSNVMNGGKVSYDSKTGVYNINYDESIYGKALISVADFGNKKGLVNIYTVNEDKNGKATYAAVDKFNAVATDTISVLGQWSIGNGEDVTLYVNGNATFTQNGQAVAQGSYQFDGKSGAITTTDGKSYQIAMNANRQLQTTVDGQTYTSLQMPAEYIDDWQTVATGDITLPLFDFAGSGFPLDYSECRGEYRLDYGKLFNAENATITFNWNRTTGAFNLLSSSGFSTGVKYDASNFIWAKVTGGNGSYDAETGIITIPVTYYIPDLGSFGAINDTFSNIKFL